MAEGTELRVECRMTRAGETGVRWIELRRRSDGEEGRVVGIVADITDRKLAEQAFIATNKTLEAEVSKRTVSLADPDARLDAFADTVSHDLRAPLRAMEGFARILLDDHGAGLGDEGERYATRIVGAAKRMAVLIDDLLAFSRVQRADLAMQAVDLRRAIRRAVADQRGAGLDKASVTVTVDAAFPLVRANRTILARALGNLIGNAAKFRAKPMRAHVIVRAGQGAGQVRIWVEDDGIGIAPEHQARIFNVFERLHGQETCPGTGVGLAIVKEGVERLGEPAGSRPRRKRAAGSGSSLGPQAAVPKKNRFEDWARSTILLVEDNPDDVELTFHAFGRAGIENPVAVVDDGDKAIDYLQGGEDHADRLRFPVPDTNLLNLKLPRRSGFEVLAAIRATEAVRRVPVVILTSSNQEDDIRRACDAGANSHLVKPVGRDALVNLVRSLDAFWLKPNLSPSP